MKFLFIGTGGIGSYYGAKLQHSGHDVTYIARGEHLRAMQQQGLSVSHDNFAFDAPVKAMDIASLIATTHCADFDVILLTAKAGATQSILDELSSWLFNANTPVLSLQNGIDSEACIENAIGQERTYGGLAVKIGGHITSPGKISATGIARIILGPWPNDKSSTETTLNHLETITRAFNEAGIPTQMSPDIQHELWRKLIINNGVNLLSALSGLDTRTLTSDPVLTKNVYRLMQEVASVAEADKVKITTTDVDEMYNLICNFEAIKTSMLVDKEKGRKLELDAISGVVLQRASSLGIETPVTELLHTLLVTHENNNSN